MERKSHLKSLNFQKLYVIKVGNEGLGDKGDWGAE